MAKDIETIERTTLTPTQSVASGNAFERLGNASSNLATMISDKLNEAQVQMEAERGQQDVESGKAPKTLSPGFNRVTRAYNNAVSDTEARHLVIGAREQIREAYENATNSANFTTASPAQFKATMQGIIDGTIENTRPSNRSQVSLALEKVAADASVDMLHYSIDYDNKQAIKTMDFEVNQLIKDRRNAAIAGESDRVAQIDEGLNKTLNDYGIQNAAIRSQLPKIRKDIDLIRKVDEVLGNFAHAASEKKQAEFLNNLAQNKDNLDFTTWEAATKAVIALDATEQNLSIQSRAIEKQTVLNGIDNGSITTTAEITNNSNLTPIDQLQLIHELEKNQRAFAKSQYKVLEAQKNIAQGHPGFNSTEIKNQMFTTARDNFEQITGHPMSLVDMWDSINGQGPSPVSGIPGVSMGANIPQFDDQLRNQLTSNDPVQVASAAMIYNNAVNVKKTPNMINLTGDALAIATHFNTLNLGNTDPMVLAQRVSDVTLKATDADYTQRSENFNKLYGSSSTGIQNTKNKFSEVFGTSYKPGINDNAMGVFKEIFREQYLKSTNETAALAATKQEMRAWGSSKYFEDGMIGQPVPEKEFTIANVGYAFDNQLRVRTQRIIDQNRQDVADNAKLPKNKQNPNPFTIEWMSPEQNINIDKLTEDDRVFKSLGQTTGITGYFRSQSKPKVKINGQETELFLMPTPESRLGDRIQYALYYHDKFGMPQPVPSVMSPTGVAMFSPVGMETWAPGILKSEQEQQVKDAALRFKKQQAMQDWNALSPGGVIGRLIQESTTGVVPGTEEQKAEIAKRYFSEEAPEIERLIKQRIQGNENAATQPREAKKADHVGISADQSNAINEVASEKKSQPASSTSVINKVYKALPRSEAEGSDVKGDVDTGSYGLTNVALKELGVSGKITDYSKEDQRKFAKEFLLKKYDELGKDLPNFDTAPKKVKEAVLHATYNIGASRVISKLKKYANNQDWLGGMKELLNISTSKGKTLVGLAKRRAEEYNAVAETQNAPMIKFVEQKKNSLNFIGDNDEVMYSIKKPRHPSSKIHRIAVPKLGNS